MPNSYGTAQSPWYTPDAGYGAKQDWRSTPFVKNFLDPQIPEGVFGDYLGSRGLGGTDAFSTWSQGQYGRTLTGYKSALRERPDLMYRDYLQRQMNKPALRNQWLGQTARARGENPTPFSGQTRMIAWG